MYFSAQNSSIQFRIRPWMSVSHSIMYDKAECCEPELAEKENSLIESAASPNKRPLGEQGKNGIYFKEHGNKGQMFRG